MLAQVHKTLLRIHLVNWIGLKSLYLVLVERADLNNNLSFLSLIFGTLSEKSIMIDNLGKTVKIWPKLQN